MGYNSRHAGDPVGADYTPDKPGQRLSGGGAGRGWSGRPDRLTEEAALQRWLRRRRQRRRDGGGGVHLLSPHLRAHLPFCVLRPSCLRRAEAGLGPSVRGTGPGLEPVWGPGQREQGGGQRRARVPWVLARRRRRPGWRRAPVAQLRPSPGGRASLTLEAPRPGLPTASASRDARTRSAMRQHWHLAFPCGPRGRGSGLLLF